MLVSANEKRRALRCSHASEWVVIYSSCSHLVLELIMEISFLFLGPDHIHDLPVFREAGGTVGITFRVTLKAVLVERVATEKVD